jgi:dolichol kinase
VIEKRNEKTGEPVQGDKLDIRAEIARKTIHLSSISIPLIYCHISRSLALILLVPLFTGFLLIDLLKNVSELVSAWYHRSFGAMLRQHELQKEHVHLNGATCITLSALLLVLFFPKMIAIAAFSMVAVSDTIAALAGKSCGKHRFGHKSLEGSTAFLASSLLIVWIVPKLHMQAGIVMALTATVAEAFVIRIGGIKLDDNLTIPLASALSGLLCYSLFFPQLLPSLAFCR